MARKYKWDFLNDFKLNDEGKYEYGGAVYVFDNAENRKRPFVKLWIMLAFMAGCSVSSGCIDAGGIMNTFYVIIPFLGEICCLFALTRYHFKLLIHDEVKEYNYSRSYPRIPVAAAILAFFAVIGFAASLIYSIATGFEGGAVKAVIYLVLKAALLAAALIYRGAFLKLRWILI